MLHSLLLFVEFPFVIIIGVAWQEYKEYNNLPHWTLGTAQFHNKYLKLCVVPLTQFGS
jgi:hypothetical protein